MAKAVSVQERLAALEEGLVRDALTQWLRTYRLTISVVLGVALLLVGGTWYVSSRRAAASESLRRGIATLQGGDAQKALEELQKARNSSVSGAEQVLGLLYLGEAYAKLGKKDEARKGYEDALSVLGTDTAGTYLEQLILVKIAQNEEGRGAEAQARQKYERAAEINGPFTTEARASAGRLAEKLNDTAAAKAQYEKLSAISPSYPLTELFQAKAGK